MSKPAPPPTKKLANPIEGFGNGPPPPPLEESTSVWAAVADASSGLTVDQLGNTMASWYDSAKDRLGYVADAIEETVDGFAEAIEDAVGLGEEDGIEKTCRNGHPLVEKSGTAVAFLSTRPCDICAADIERGDPRWNCFQCSYDVCKKCHKGQVRPRQKVAHAEDPSERSAVDWVVEVEAICIGGDLDAFVSRVRVTCKNKEEQEEVGKLVSEQLLNEVDSDAIHRILYVVQAVIGGDLPEATAQIKTLCLSKLEKLRTLPVVGKVAIDVLETLRAVDAGADPKTTASKRSVAAAPAAPVDLLGMDEPAAPTTQNKVAVASSRVKEKPKQQDLLDFSTDVTPPALPPPAKSSGTSLKPTAPFAKGDHVQAVWAGNGQTYPAIVQSCTATHVEVQWLRASFNADPSQKFVSDVGDDLTHCNVLLQNIKGKVSTAASRSQPQTSDLLGTDDDDLNAVFSGQPAAPVSNGPAPAVAQPAPQPFLSAPSQQTVAATPLGGAGNAPAAVMNGIAATAVTGMAALGSGPQFLQGGSGGGNGSAFGIGAPQSTGLGFSSSAGGLGGSPMGLQSGPGGALGSPMAFGQMGGAAPADSGMGGFGSFGSQMSPGLVQPANGAGRGMIGGYGTSSLSTGSMIKGKDANNPWESLSTPVTQHDTLKIGDAFEIARIKPKT
mmetsp:Transcript_71431/g.190438  ORF Transcript_71431/g.190438 Transcript_71431/m.190438 type:complete len:668 (+) Transcript_71431:79-2082(+)